MFRIAKAWERMIDFWKDEPEPEGVFSEKEIRTFVLSVIGIILFLIILGVGVIGLVFKILLGMAGGF